MNRLVPIVGLVLASLVLVKAVRPVIAEALDPQQATVSGVVYEDRNGNDRETRASAACAGSASPTGSRRSRPTRQGSTDSRWTWRAGSPTWCSSPSRRATTCRPTSTRPRGSTATWGSSRTAPGRAPTSRCSPTRAGAATTSRSPTSPTHTATRTWPSRCARSPQTSKELAFVQVSGDLTDNATDAEFMHVQDRHAASKLPVWPAVGNHEYFNAGPSTYEARIDNYRRHVGPEWYSFDHGRRHFLVLENNGAAPIEEQREWMKADLEEHARGQARGRAHAHADERAVRLAVGLRRLRASARAVRARSWCWSATSTPTTSTTRPGSRAPSHIQTNSSSYTIDHSPRGFRYVTMKGPRFEQPVPDVRRRRSSLAVTSPAPGAELTDLDEVQVSAYHTGRARQGRDYRLDRRGRWHSLKPSGDFTWYGDIDDDRGSHEIEVVAVDESGARWSETSTFSVRRGRAPRIEPGADWAQFHGDQPAQRCRRRPARTRSAAGVDAPHARRVPHRLAGDRRRRRLRRRARRERNRARRRARRRAGQRPQAVGVRRPVVGPRHPGGVRRHGARPDTPRDAVRGRAPAPAGCAGSASPSRGRRRSTSASYSYYSPAVADGTVYWPYQTRYGKASRGLLSALDARTGAREVGVADDAAPR